VVVAVGLTTWVPPVGCSVYELPSLPVTVTWAALVALTVNVDEPPATIAVGLAVTVTVGAGEVLPLYFEHPVLNTESTRHGIAARRSEMRDLGASILIMVSSS